MSQLPAKKIGIVLVLMLIVGIFLYINIEKYTTKERIRQPYEVRKNPYLAAEHYLKQRHQPTKVNNNSQFFNTLSSERQTALLLGNRNIISPAQNQLILDWVKRGGTLIVEASKETMSGSYKYTDNLLNPLGIQLRATSDLSDNAQLYIENEQQPVILEFTNSWQLVDEKDRATLWAETKHHTTKLLQFPYGKGKITVMSDADIWKNQTINESDHAWLLSYLTANQPVTILYTSSSQTKEHPSVLLAAIKHYPYTLLLAVLLILAMLWYKGVRSGPLEPAIERNRRQLPLQLAAQGNFLYKHIGQQQLITLLQQEIYYLVNKRSPHFNGLPTDEQFNFLSKLTQQPLTTISQMMSPIASHRRLSKLEFTRTIIALQAIRNAL